MLNTIGFLGCGNMGGAIARAVCKAADPQNVWLANRTAAKAEALAAELGCNTTINDEVAGRCDLIFLAVKPQMMEELLAPLRFTLAERPSRGAVLFGERNLAKVRGSSIAHHRRNVGVVYQNHQLLMDRSVAENVALPLVLRGIKRGEIGKRVRSILDRLGLAARERALPAQLSAGEQQRVGIARAVIAEPAMLIADEPTGNLDPTLSAEIMALFASLPEKGTSVLVASHDLGLVKRMRKRVLVLDHGRLLDDIAPEDLADE